MCDADVFTIRFGEVWAMKVSFANKLWTPENTQNVILNVLRNVRSKKKKKGWPFNPFVKDGRWFGRECKQGNNMESVTAYRVSLGAGDSLAGFHVDADCSHIIGGGQLLHQNCQVGTDELAAQRFKEPYFVADSIQFVLNDLEKTTTVV